MFNPIPKDAPEFFTTKAHYIDVKHTVSSRGINMDREKQKTRFYIFSIGRSVKNYVLMDKYIDDKALEMLERSRADKKRLVIKGYTSHTNGTTMFVILTHIGIYVKHGIGFQVYNPETGAKGYYQLSIM